MLTLGSEWCHPKLFLTLWRGIFSNSAHNQQLIIAQQNFPLDDQCPAWEIPMQTLPDYPQNLLQPRATFNAIFTSQFSDFQICLNECVELILLIKFLYNEEASIKLLEKY